MAIDKQGLKEHRFLSSTFDSGILFKTCAALASINFLISRQSVQYVPPKHSAREYYTKGINHKVYQSQNKSSREICDIKDKI